MNLDLRVDHSHLPAAPNWTAPVVVSATPVSEFSNGAVHRETGAPHSVVREPEAANGSNDACDVAMRHAHLDDVATRLQQWASGLDAREANLNAREALLEHRERASRTWAAHLRQELEAQRLALEQMLRDAEVERQRIQSALRGQCLGQLRAP